MSDDFLKKMNQQADHQIGHAKSPFSQKSEGSHPVQIREGIYREIKKRAFFNDQKMIDVVDAMLKYDINSKHFDK